MNMEALNNRCTGLCESCGKCKGANLLNEMNERKTKLLFIPEDFIPDEGGEQYGVAFDIGTTTVVGMLWDLKENQMIGNIAMTNPQNEFGADVISRIQYCQGKPEKLKIIRGKIITSLNEMINTLCSQNTIEKSDVIRVAVGGNTTMSHIFAGYDPTTLALAPFNPAYTGLKEFKPKEIGLEVGELANIILVPNIAGHVGGDITAGIIATRLMNASDLTLFIDIGTNGEIVLSTKDKTVACSTAAGPAFEGAAIYQGMRAAAGAIERLKIQEGAVLFQTIENCEPVGICGSGLIDAIAEMFRVGIIKKNGKLLMEEELTDEKLKKQMGNRLRKTGDQKEFVLVFKENTEDIVITQKDIREVQLAKGAIYAGVKILLEELGFTIGDIDKVIIAGAFGNYINKESAVTMSLLPAVEYSKIVSVGNAAGVGTSMILLSKEELENSQLVVEKVAHIELATYKNFQDEYLRAMSF